MIMFYLGFNGPELVTVGLDENNMPSNYRLVYSVSSSLSWYCPVEKLVPITALLEALI
jgi:hypothetical protein